MYMNIIKNKSNEIFFERNAIKFILTSNNFLR